MAAFRREPKSEVIRARVSASQKARVLAAAAKAKLTAAEFLRVAALAEAEAILSDSLLAQFGDFIGILDGANLPPARERRRTYLDLLLEENAPERRRTEKNGAPEKEPR